MPEPLKRLNHKDLEYPMGEDLPSMDELSAQEACLKLKFGDSDIVYGRNALSSAASSSTGGCAASSSA